MVTAQQQYDVIVVGAGNAALSAAISAHENGAKVLVLEKAPQELRGGDTYFAGGGFRLPLDGIREIQEIIPGLPKSVADNIYIAKYTSDDFYADFMRITQGLADADLVEVIVKESSATIRWMAKHGVIWDLLTIICLRINDRLCWPEGCVPVGAKGGGAGLSDMLFNIVQQKGIELAYETKVTKLLLDSRGKICGITIKDKNGFSDIKAKAVVLACGGFQANREWRAKYLGSPWDTVKLRGTKYNTGDGLRMALEIGAQPAGQWTGCHATPIDADAPDIASRAHTDESNRISFHLGISVNVHGKRYVDEGEDFNILTYAKQGRAILVQPQNIAYQIFDSRVKNLLESRYSKGICITADSIKELAQKLDIDENSLASTVEEYNDSLSDTKFDPIIKDGKCTSGISPGKSNWANRLDSPPFLAYPATCGITFTFGGLKINREARVLDTEDQVIPGLFAAGEIVGGLFYGNYPGAAGFTSGSVLGRIAGANAAGA